MVKMFLTTIDNRLLRADALPQSSKAFVPARMQAQYCKSTDCFALMCSHNPACIRISGYRPTLLMQGRLPSVYASFKCKHAVRIAVWQHLYSMFLRVPSAKIVLQVNLCSIFDTRYPCFASLSARLTSRFSLASSLASSALLISS